MTTSVIFLVVAAATTAVILRSALAIVGGTEAERDEFQYIVLIQDNSNPAHSICGATIVNENWVLTSAVCAIMLNKTMNMNSYTLLAGRHDLNSDLLEESEQRRKVVQIQFHTSSFDPSNSYAHDLAVMKVDSPFQFGEFVKSARFPDFTVNDTGVIENLITAGWGTLSEGGTYPNKLMKVIVESVPYGVCQTNYGGFVGEGPIVLNGMMCAGSGGKDSCLGDTGGPLVNTNGTVVGISSWGYSCGSDNYPGVYTDLRTQNYSTWIRDSVK